MSQGISYIAAWLSSLVIPVILAVGAHFLSPQTTQAQFAERDTTRFEVRSHITHAFKTTVNDYAYTGRSLGHLSKKEWKGLFIVATTSAQFMLFFDKPIDEWIKKRPNSVAGVVWRDIARVGHTYDIITPDGLTVAMSASLISAGLIKNDKYMLRTAGMIIEAQLFTTFATAMMKHAFGRSRPYATTNPLVFDPFTFGEIRAYIDIPRAMDPRNSFPSGHTSGIFAMMAVIANRYDAWYIRIPAYAYATTVGLNRMNNPSHWGSDVIFGAMLGWYIGTRISESDEVRKKRTGPEPMIGSAGTGLRWRF